MSDLFEGMNHDSNGMYVERFDPLAPDTLQNMPKLRAGMEKSITLHKADLIAYTNQWGRVPIRLSRWKGNKFKDTAFKWIPQASSPEQANALEQLEDEVWGYAPFYHKSHDYSLDLEELERFYGDVSDNALYYLNGVLEDAHRYCLLRAMLEASDVVGYLIEQEKQFSYYKHYDEPLLVVDDSNVALYLKLAYG